MRPRVLAVARHKRQADGRLAVRPCSIQLEGLTSRPVRSVSRGLVSIHRRLKSCVKGPMPRRLCSPSLSQITWQGRSGVDRG
jgi:hypothetical protein